MIDLGALKLTIEVNSGDAKRELTDFKNEAEKTQSTLKSRIATAGKVATAGIVAVGGACVVAGKKMYEMAMDTAEVADRIDKMSQKMGISKQSFQEWDYICKQNGVDVGVFQNGLKTLQTQMLNASNGTSEAVSAFDKLGVSWEDGTGKLKSNEEMMREAISALAGMEEGAERTQLATQLFGKAGGELAPILNAGADGIDELTKRCHDLGLVMADETISAGVNLGDTIADVKASFSAIGTQIGAEFMPIIQQVAQWIIANMPTIQAVVSKVFNVVQSCIGFIMPLISALMNLIGALVKSTQKDGTLLNYVWNQISNVISTAIGIAKGVITAFTALIQGDWEGCFNALFDTVQTIFEGINNWISNAIDFIIGIVEGLDLSEAGKNAINSLLNGFKNMWGSISSWVNEKIGWIKEKFGQAWNSANTPTGHRIGFDYVPYDGYSAILHKGEMVLTAPEADRYRRGQSENENVGNTNITVNNYSPKALDASESARLYRQTQRELALGF